MSTYVSNLGVEMSWVLVLRKRQTKLGGTRSCGEKARQIAANCRILGNCGAREFFLWNGRINGPHRVNRMLFRGSRYCGTPGLSEARLKSCSTLVLWSADGSDRENGKLQAHEMRLNLFCLLKSSHVFYMILAIKSSQGATTHFHTLSHAQTHVHKCLGHDCVCFCRKPLSSGEAQ